MGAIQTQLSDTVAGAFKRLWGGEAAGVASEEAAPRMADDLLKLNPAARLKQAVATARTDVGAAVNRAVARAERRTVPAQEVFTKGSIEALWINDPDLNNEAMAQVARQIRETKAPGVVLQSFALHGDSQGAHQVFAAVAARQKADPDFGLALLHTGEYSLPFYSKDVQKVLAKHRVKAHVASYMNLPTTAVNHSKSYHFGSSAAFGGNNIQNFAEKDYLVHVKGDVTRGILSDAEDAWLKSKKHYYFDGRTASPRRNELPELFGKMRLFMDSQQVQEAPRGREIPMTILSKGAGRASKGSDANAGLYAAVARGKTGLKLQTPNMNEKELLETVIAKAEAGVPSQVMLSRDHNALKAMFAGGSNRQIVRKIAKLPQPVRDLIEVRWWSPDGKTVAKNHTKYVEVNGEWAYLGPQNLDKQSFWQSREIGVGIDDPGTVKMLGERIFDQDWQRAIPAKPLSLWQELTTVIPFLKRFNRVTDPAY